MTDDHTEMEISHQTLSDDQPLRIGPPRFVAAGGGMGKLEVIDPISVDATLNQALCSDDECDCDHKPVYLVMIELEITEIEFNRLCNTSGWVDSDDDPDLEK